MAYLNRQPGWDAAINRFVEQVDRCRAEEILDPTSTPQRTRPFVPIDEIKAYFEDQQCTEFFSILSALFPSGLKIYPKEILPKYTAVFCILLYIGRGQYIDYFRHYNSLSDAALPFNPAHPPANIPHAAEDPGFLNRFCEEQWRFCAQVLEDNLEDKHFESERVLPIISKQRLAGGRSANLWKIKIHPSYNKIISKEEKAVRFSS